MRVFKVYFVYHLRFSLTTALYPCSVLTYHISQFVWYFDPLSVLEVNINFDRFLFVFQIISNILRSASVCVWDYYLGFVLRVNKFH